MFRTIWVLPSRYPYSCRATRRFPTTPVSSFPLHIPRPGILSAVPPGLPWCQPFLLARLSGTSCSSLMCMRRRTFHAYHSSAGLSHTGRLCICHSSTPERRYPQTTPELDQVRVYSFEFALDSGHQDLLGTTRAGPCRGPSHIAIESPFSKFDKIIIGLGPSCVYPVELDLLLPSYEILA